MPRPTFQIWKNKPGLNDFGQYISVDTEDYYSIGFDTDDGGVDDIYTNYNDIGRSVESGLNQPDYFNENSINLKDHIYGVGQVRIEKLKIKLGTANNTNNHNNTEFQLYWVDSAVFQCPTGAEPGCDLSDGGLPQEAVDPITGDYLIDDTSMHDRFNTGEGGFLKNRRFYRAKAGSNFDCAWGNNDEFEPNNSFQLIGEKIVDTAQNASLNYYPSPRPDASSDTFIWNFFPHVNHDNVKNTNYYGYTSDAFPLYEHGMTWEEFVIGDVFSNAINTDWGGNQNYVNDYDDGAFYFIFRNYGDRCDNHQSGNFSLNKALVIYTIPKKEVYDNWNGYRPICFKWGSDYNCWEGDIVISKDIPPVAEDNNGVRNYYGFKSQSARIRFIPPRVFYEDYSVATDESLVPSNVDEFRPVNNENPSKHLKNPIEKDPTNPYFSQLTPCVFTGEQVFDPITNETFTCLYSAFYPYVYEGVPYLFSPTNDVDFTGNLVGITDGTADLDRTDGVTTGFSTSSYLTANILRDITLNTDYIMDREFRPISYAWVGDTNIDDGLTVQRRYEPRSTEEAQTSAPNFVNFWFSLMSPVPDNNKMIDEEDLFNFSDEMWADDIYLGTGMGYKWCIARWGDEDDANTITDEELFEELKGWSTLEQLYAQEVLQTGRYDWVNIKDDNGLGIFSHQYQSEGPKEVKAFVFSYIKNIDQSNTFNRLFGRDDIIPFQTIHWKLVTIRININLSDVFVEDFSEIGGNDFTYIPMNTLTPIIGGIHKNSRYFKSIKEISEANLFDPAEVLDKMRTKKALENDNMGYWPGSMDLEQIRLFKSPYDMSYLLGIGNQMAVTANRFRPHDYKSYWDGIENSFSDETSVGEIFIDDNVDKNLKSSCVLELNTSNLFGNKVLDSSGNGNVGILIGDYSLSKPDRLEPVTREQSMKTPNVGTENGAI